MHSIQPLKPETYPQILTLNGEAQPAVTRLDENELLRLSILSDAHHVVVDSNDVVVGYMLAFYYDANYDGEEFGALRKIITAPFLYVDQIVISSAVRGTGLGRALYHRMEMEAMRREIHVLCCDVNTLPLNAASLAFHYRLGFKQIGSLPTTDGRQAALLKKTLHHGA
jgi:predicted GNAT superfamily acetyltransferase